MVNKMKIAMASFFAFSLLFFAHLPSSHALSKSVEIKVSAYVAPIFELSVEGPDNGNIEFGTIYRDTQGAVTVQSKEVVIKARSNMGQPYQITQALVAPLANEEGKSFAEGSITAHAQNVATNGVSQASAPVSTASSVLFNSNTTGKSDTVKATYDLEVEPEQDAGQYSTGLVYTITTL